MGGKKIYVRLDIEWPAIDNRGRVLPLKGGP
jgi:hypothetical protein